MMPLPYGSEDEERCVAFVGLTRATETLRFAYGESAWESGWRWGHPREGAEGGWLLERLRSEAGEPPSPESASPQARAAAARERLREQAQQLRSWQAQQTQGEMPAALAQLLAAREQQQATQEAVRGEQTAGERPLPDLVKEVMQELKVKAMSQKAAQDVGAKAAPANLVLPVPSAQDDFLRQLFGDAAVQVEGEQVRGEVQRIPLFPQAEPPQEEGLTALEASRRRLAQRQREIMATKLIRLRAFAHLEDGDHTVPYGALRQVLENIRYGLWLERARWAAMVLRELRSRPEGAGVYLSARAFAYLERLSEAFVEHRALAYQGAEGHELVGVMGRSGLEVQRAALISETDREIVVELEEGKRLRFTPWLDAWGGQETFLIRPLGADLTCLPVRKQIVCPA